jgi:ketosteroid isomerase-like protein
MKFSIIIFFTCTLLQVTGQSIQMAINNQVWKPFISTYNNRDTDGFMAVHSKDVVRSPRDGKMVLNWNEYFEQQKRGDDQGKTSGNKRELGLRFTERIANDNQAMEVGIYKVVIAEKTGNVTTFYGRFHVAVRKENGVWKILVDTDSSAGNSMDEQDYMQAGPME